jgi:hypothetical protein
MIKKYGMGSDTKSIIIRAAKKYPTQGSARYF